MKKERRLIQKLKIHRETLRVLEAELEEAVGGKTGVKTEKDVTGCPCIILAAADGNP